MGFLIGLDIKKRLTGYVLLFLTYTLGCCCSSFIADVVLHSLTFDVIPHSSVSYGWVFTPIYTFSPAHSIVIHDTFILTFLGPSVTVLPRVLRIWKSAFNSQSFFTLLSFPTFGTICFYQGFPGSLKFFLESCKTFHWGSKHRPDPSTCLNQTVFSRRY